MSIRPRDINAGDFAWLHDDLSVGGKTLCAGPYKVQQVFMNGIEICDINNGPVVVYFEDIEHHQAEMRRDFVARKPRGEK